MRISRLILVPAALLLTFTVSLLNPIPARAAANFTATPTCSVGSPYTINVQVADIDTTGSYTYTVNAKPLNGAPFTYVSTYIGFPARNFPFEEANGTYTITVTRVGDGAEVSTFDVQCPPPPSPVTATPEPVARGPFIPSGFVLSTITCDVAVFDAPAGTPVAGSVITGGQTWYVNPAPEEGADGEEWSEIFTSGPVNGYIPTICIG